MTPQKSPSLPLANEFTFSDEQLLSVCELTDELTCRCLAHLVGLLWQVRKFHHYTTDCINHYPETAEEHCSMQEQLLQVDALLSQSLSELLQWRNLLNDQQEINLQAFKEYQLRLMSTSTLTKAI